MNYAGHGHPTTHIVLLSVRTEYNLVGRLLSSTNIFTAVIVNLMLLNANQYNYTVLDCTGRYGNTG